MNVLANQTKDISSSTDPKISIILPTRKRPEKAKNFLFSLKKNCRNLNLVEIIICIDEDDKSYEDFEPIFTHTKFVKRRRCGLGEIIYEGIKNSTGDIIFLCNDDVTVETFNWDEAFRKVHMSFADKIYLFSPNDLNKKGALFVFPGFSRKVFEILGDYPKFYAGAFMDNHLYEIFESLKFHGHNRKVFLSEIIFYHQHYKVTGEIPDKTYTDRDRFGDDFTFFSSVKMRFLDTKSLISFIKHKQICQKERINNNSIINSALFYLFSSYLPLRIRLQTLVYMLSRCLYRAFTT